MIFPKSIVGRIERGAVTATIRPAAGRPPRPLSRRCVKASQHGAIACYITILDVEEMHAGDVTFRQTKAAGYRTTAEWKAAWVEQHDARWREARDETTEAEKLLRFNARHAHKPVWVIAFTTTVDTPRFLAPPGQGTVDINGNADYTENPGRAIDDLEVIDTATQERYSKDALAFCIGRQLNRQKEEAAKRDARARQSRRAA